MEYNYAIFPAIPRWLKVLSFCTEGFWIRDDWYNRGVKTKVHTYNLPITY